MSIRRLTGVVALLLSAAAFGQSYPAKPIRMIVPFSAGGGSDIVARIIGQRIGDAMGQPVVVENRPGAASMIGTEIVANAPADGYTLLLADSSFTINQAYFRKPSYSVKQFVPVARIAETPYVLIAHPSVAAANLRDFIAFAKSQPGKVSLGSSGNGSGSHMAFELFQLETGTRFNHIPYKGSAQSMADTLSGQVQGSFTTAPSVVPHYKAGRLKVHGAASPARSGALPDVPTFSEQGFRNVVVTNWYGVVAPAGTPAAVVAKLYTEISRAGRLAATTERLATTALDPSDGTPEQFGDMIAGELGRWARVISDAKIQME